MKHELLASHLTEDQTWVMAEKLKPELLPPAGQTKIRPTGKRMVAENSNTLSRELQDSL